MVELNIHEIVYESGAAQLEGKRIIKTLDLSNETVMTLSQDIFDMTDITKTSDKFSYSFKLPATENNNRFFENFGNLNWVGNAKYKSWDAELVINGISMFRGQFVLDEYETTTRTYSGRLVGDIFKLSTQLKGKDMTQLKWLNQFDHKYTGVDTIKLSWEGKLPIGFGSSPTDVVNPKKEIFYPLSDYQGVGYWHTSNDGSKFYSCFGHDHGKEDVFYKPLDGASLTPAIKFIPLVKAIFEEAGYKTDLSYYTGERWDNLYLNTKPIDDKLKKTSSPLAKLRLSNSMKVHISDSKTFTPKLDALEGSRYVRNLGYRVPTDGSYTIKYHVKGYNNYEWLGRGNDTYVRLMKRKTDGSHEKLIEKELPDGSTAYGTNFEQDFDLKAGEYIFIEVKFSHALRGSTFYVAQETGFEVVKAPTFEVYQDRKLGDYFGKFKQVDIIKEFLSLSNAVIEYQEDNNTIKVTPLIVKWIDNSTPQLDITDKVDISDGFVVKPATSEMPSEIEFKWKDKGDYLSESYKASNGGVGYGDTQLIATNILNAGKKFTHKSKFGNYITGAVSSRDREVRNGIESNTSDLIIPMMYKDVNKFSKVNGELSLFYWNGKLRQLPETDFVGILNWIGGDEIGGANKYPMCHNLLFKRDNYTFSPGVVDINWEASIPYSINGDFAGSGINNNLFDQYYYGYLKSLYEDDTILIKTRLNLTPGEFSNLNLWAPVTLKGGRYRILKYEDYDLINNKPMKIWLMKDNIVIHTNLKPSVHAVWYSSTQTVDVSWVNPEIDPIHTTIKWSIDGATTTKQVDGLTKYTIPGITQDQERKILTITVTNDYGLSRSHSTTYELVIVSMAVLRPSELTASYDYTTHKITFGWTNSNKAVAYDLYWVDHREDPTHRYTKILDVTSPVEVPMEQTKHEQQISWYVKAIASDNTTASANGPMVVINPTGEGDVVPTGLFASYSSADEKMTFNWGPLSQSDSVEVVWEECGDCYPSAHVAMGDGGITSLEVPLPQPDTLDYVRWFVRNNIGNTSHRSITSRLTIPAQPLPTVQISNLEYNQEQGYITVTWTPDPKVQGYNVSMMKDGVWQGSAVHSTAQAIQSGSYDWTHILQDLKPVEYTFEIISMKYNPDNDRWYNTDSRSDQVSITVPARAAEVPEVDRLVFPPYEGTVAILFKEVDGATGYDIKFKLDDDPFVVTEDVSYKPWSESGFVYASHSIINEVAERTVSMAVRARFPQGVTGWSQVRTIKTIAVDPHDAENLRFGSLDDTAGTIDFLWDYDDMVGIDKFIVYKQQPGDSVLKKHEVGKNKKYTFTNIHRTDKDYSIKACVEVWTELGRSNRSRLIAKTIPALLPSQIVPKAPVNVVASNTNGVTKVTWSKVINADKYYVYSSNTWGGTYLKLGERLDESYTDFLQGAPGTTIYYKIKAVNSVGESEFSHWASVEFPMDFSGGDFNFGGPTGENPIGGILNDEPEE